MKIFSELFFRDKRICPWWLAYTFDNPLRRFVQEPQAIVRPYLREGMTAIDIGCGMGYFSRSMAKIVGDSGTVIAVDVQQEMIDIARKRAEKDGVTRRIRFVRVKEDDLLVTDQVDFALAFWMVHEVNDTGKFFAQVRNILKPSGTLLIAEPKMHVTQPRFEEMLSIARGSGFTIYEAPRIRFSRSVAMRNLPCTTELLTS
ncbi:MAG TPA: class I SAM-dependent methyltransferase [Nitrospirota bacterium]|nr:class I SAM-dependent methyltransferase [Nitrospirota bacterium]